MKALKAQVFTYFIVETTINKSDIFTRWIVFVDESSNIKQRGTRLFLENDHDHKIKAVTM